MMRTRAERRDFTQRKILKRFHAIRKSRPWMSRTEAFRLAQSRFVWTKWTSDPDEEE